MNSNHDPYTWPCGLRAKVFLARDMPWHLARAHGVLIALSRKGTPSIARRGKAHAIVKMYFTSAIGGQSQVAEAANVLEQNGTAWLSFRSPAEAYRYLREVLSCTNVKIIEV